MFLKKRFNVHLFLWLLGGLVVLAPSVHFLHAFQVKRTASLLLHEAKKAEDEGNLSKALGYLSRYVALEPKNAQARAKFGLLLADDKVATTPKALGRAYFALLHALLLDGEQNEVRRRVIQLAMDRRIDRFNDAAAHLDKLFEQNVKDAELYGWRGICHEIKGDFKKARQCYEEALRQPKKEEEHYIRLAFLLLNQGEKVMVAEKTKKEVFQTADQKVEEMLAAFPRSHVAYLLSARYYLRKDAESADNTPENVGWDKRVARDLGMALTLAPNEIDVLLLAAEVELEKQKGSEGGNLLEHVFVFGTGIWLPRPKAPESRVLLERGIKLHPKEWRFYQLLARLEMEKKQPDAAVAALKRGLAMMPKQLDLLWNLANLHLHQGQNEEAETLIARLDKEGFPPLELDYLKGRLLVNKKQWIKAVRLLERTYPQLVGRHNQYKDWIALNLAQECNLLVARCYQRMGDPYRAATTYAQVITRDPKSVAARLGLARMEWASGRLDIASREYKLLMQNRQAPAAAWIECAQMLVLRNLQQTKPNWLEVEQVLNEAANLKPVPVEVAILRAEIYAAENDLEKARNLLDKEYVDAEAGPVEVWVGSSVLEERGGKKELALAILDKAEQKLGDHLELRIARARYSARQGGADAVRALGKLAQDAEQWTEVDRRRLTEELAQAYLRIGETKLAVDAWRAIATQQGSDVGSRLVLFDLALQMRDEASMGRLVNELKDIEGEEGTLWRYCQAVRLIWQAETQKDNKGLTEARGLLTFVRGRRANWFRVPVAEGQINELLKREEAAILKYREALNMGEQNPAVIRRLVGLLFKKNRILEVGTLLEKLREQTETATLSDLYRVEAVVAIGRNNPELALKNVEKAVSRESKDYRDHIWRGQMLEAAGKQEDAEAALQKAIDLNQTSPDPWVALIQFAIRRNDRPKAEAVLNKAHQKIPRDEALLPLALCHEWLNQSKRAEELYAAALAAKPEDTKVLQSLALFHLRLNDANLRVNQPVIAKEHLEQAEKHLNKIIQLKSGPAEYAQARRALALVLASSGNFQQTQKALELLDIVDETGRNDDLSADANLDDERAKVVILARQSNPRQRRQAIDILKEVARRQSITDGERLILAQLYESVGEWREAREQMVLLLSSAEDKLERTGQDKANLANLKATFAAYLTQYCASLLRRETWEDAIFWVAKLEKLEPDSLRTVTTKARLLGKQGRGKDAVGPLIALADKDLNLVRPVARLLEEIGQEKEAEKMFLKFVAQSQAKSPESVLVLAQFLGRQDRSEEALALCEKAWQNCKPEAVAETSVLILYTTKSPGKENWRQVATWLARESKNKPKDTMLLGYLAAVRRLAKDYDEVVALCRRILELDKTDTTAMNNLAWMFALHSNNAKEALQWIDKAILLEGPRESLLDTRAVIYLKQGRAKDAVKDLEEAVAESPTAYRYFHLAQAHLMAQNRAGAVSAFLQAEKLGLRENAIDPLEQSAYQQVVNQLKSR